MMTTRTEKSTTSADGTQIAFETQGEGPALILIETALHYRGLSPFDALIPLLATEFTTVVYDRRGRGKSGDNPSYSPEREVEDIEALISAVGGPVFLSGYYSGALLAMHAAARGLPISRMALLEPPLQPEDTQTPSPLTTSLSQLVAQGKDAETIETFLQSIGVPDEFISQRRQGPEWEKMVNVAPTLVYDCTISDATTPDILQSINQPTLVLDSQGSSDDLTGWAAEVAAQLPNATSRSLPGQWHSVAPETLAEVLTPFFKDGAAG